MFNVTCLNSSSLAGTENILDLESEEEIDGEEESFTKIQEMFKKLFDQYIKVGEVNESPTLENGELKKKVAELEGTLVKKEDELYMVKTELDSTLKNIRQLNSGVALSSNSPSTAHCLVKENRITESSRDRCKNLHILMKKLKRPRVPCVYHYFQIPDHIHPFCFKLRKDFYGMLNKLMFPEML